MKAKLSKSNGVCSIQRATEQINGREGETATLLSTGLFTLNLRGGGFAPRHLKRWVLRGEIGSLPNSDTLKFAKLL